MKECVYGTRMNDTECAGCILMFKERTASNCFQVKHPHPSRLEEVAEEKELKKSCPVCGNSGEHSSTCTALFFEELKNPDKINPSHYKVGGIETYDFIKAKELGYSAGQVIKYVVRHEHKNGLEDLKKAKWYLDKLISEIGAKIQKGYKSGKSQKIITLDEGVGWVD